MFSPAASYAYAKPELAEIATRLSSSIHDLSALSIVANSCAGQPTLQRCVIGLEYV